MLHPARKPVLLPPGVASTMVGVSPRKLARMATERGIQIQRTTGQHRRYHYDDVRVLAAELGDAA